jgi:hypothetical protein
LKPGQTGRQNNQGHFLERCVDKVPKSTPKIESQEQQDRILKVASHYQATKGGCKRCVAILGGA